jgi:hypothetical protein
MSLLSFKLPYELQLHISRLPLKSPPQTWGYTLLLLSQTRPSSPSNPAAPYARHLPQPTAPSTRLSPSSCPAAYSAQSGSQSCPRTWGQFRWPVAAQLRPRVGGRGGAQTRPVRRASAVIGIARFVRVLQRRRMRIGISRRPGRRLSVLRVGYNVELWGGSTSRMPTHDSAMLTRRLSCAHLRARWASLVARSARFCWRWICTMRATLLGS